jgi:hypothetical protein
MIGYSSQLIEIKVERSCRMIIEKATGLAADIILVEEN